MDPHQRQGFAVAALARASTSAVKAMLSAVAPRSPPVTPVAVSPRMVSALPSRHRLAFPEHNPSIQISSGSGVAMVVSFQQASDTHGPSLRPGSRPIGLALRLTRPASSIS